VKAGPGIAGEPTTNFNRQGIACLDLKKLIPLYLGAAMGPMGGFGIVTILPVLAQSWSVAFGTAAAAITLYMVPFIVIQIFSGAIAQIFDVRKTLLFGFGLYTVGAVLSAMAPDLWTFLLFRVFQGIGAGFLTPIIMALIGELVPEHHLGRAIGLLGVAYTVGVTLGPYLSGVIEVHLGWRWFFHFQAAVAALAGTLYWINRPEAAERTHPSGRLLAILPVLRRALAQPGVLATSFAAFSLFLAYIGIMTFTADHLKTSLHLPSDRVGTLLSITGFSGIIVSPIAGYLGDRLGRIPVFLGGTAVVLLAILPMRLVPFDFTRHLGFFLVLGIGSATAWTSLNTMAVRLSTTLRQPVTSLYNAIKFSGYALAPVAFSVIYKPYRLQGVLVGCMAAVLAAAGLAWSARAHSQ
jgi:predicted MFS family arabinose efflux permease